MRSVLKITLPLVAANLVVGALLAFSFSMMEVSDSLILAQKAEFYPITKAIYELSQYLGAGPVTAAAFGVWSMCFLASILAAASVLRSVAGGLDQTPAELERAARNAGAGFLRSVLKITLPLVAANLVVGALFAFSFSMMEVSDSLILAQKAEFYPITKAIYELSQYLGAGPVTAAAFGVWSMCFLASILVAASVLLGKKIGSLFSI